MDNSIKLKIISLYNSLVNNEKETISEQFRELSKYINQCSDMRDIVDINLCRTLGLFLHKRTFNDKNVHLKWLIRSLYLNLYLYYNSDSIIIRNECLWIAISALKRNFDYILPILISTSESTFRLGIMSTFQTSQSEKEIFLDHYKSMVYYAIVQMNNRSVTENMDKWLADRVVSIIENKDAYFNFGKSNETEGARYISLMYYWLNIYCNNSELEKMKNSVLNCKFQATHVQYTCGLNCGEGETTATVYFSLNDDLIEVSIRGLNESLIATDFSYNIREYNVFSDSGYIKISPDYYRRDYVQLQPRECYLVVDKGNLTAIGFEGLSLDGNIYNFIIEGYQIKDLSNNRIKDSDRFIIGDDYNFNIDSKIDAEIVNNYLPVRMNTIEFPYLGDVIIVSGNPLSLGRFNVTFDNESEIFIISNINQKFDEIKSLIFNYEQWNPSAEYNFITVSGYFFGANRKIHIQKTLL